MDNAELQSLVDILSAGFETLLVEVRRQRQIEIALREKVQFAQHEYQSLSQRSDRDGSEPSADVLRRLSTDPAAEISRLSSIPLKDASLDKPEIAAASKACRSLKSKRETNGDVTPPKKKIQPYPVTPQAIVQEELERDFTTPGVQSNLQCPFAKTAPPAFPNTPDSAADPIAAEFHQDKVSVQSSQHAGKATCPIRYLEQHSPEEVAQYFENHKHEIPRSHEICVRRYQRNESSIRELDAKYGSLVNMIQGLGVKHKQYLPEKDTRDGTTQTAEAEDGSSTRAVEKWAEDVSQKPEFPGPEDVGYDEADKEERAGRLEKPLRDVRVGESPSRPWGIPVPADEEEAESAASSAKGEGQLPFTLGDIVESPAQMEMPKCPFGHDKSKAAPEFGKFGKSKAAPEFGQFGKSKAAPEFGQFRKSRAAPEFGHFGKSESIPEPPPKLEAQRDQRPGPETYKAERHNIVFSGPIIIGNNHEQAIEFIRALKAL